jgi:hypothetical protein
MLGFGKIKQLEQRIESIEAVLESNRREKNCEKGLHSWILKDFLGKPYIGCDYCYVTMEDYDKKKGGASC